MIRYHLNLLNAEHTHPGIINMLEDGAFSVRRTKKSFSRTAVDMTLEQTVNADAASRHRGMGAFVHLNPFDLEVEENLYCLTSGQKVEEPGKDDLLNFLNKGKLRSDEFRNACFQDATRFEKPIPRRKIKNFASASVKSKFQSKKWQEHGICLVDFY